MGGGPQAAPASLPSRGPAVPPALLDHLGVAGWQSRTKRVCSAGAPEQARIEQDKGLGACSAVPWRCNGVYSSAVKERPSDQRYARWECKRPSGEWGAGAAGAEPGPKGAGAAQAGPGGAGRWIKQ